MSHHHGTVSHCTSPEHPQQTEGKYTEFRNCPLTIKLTLHWTRNVFDIACSDTGSTLVIKGGSMSINAPSTHGIILLYHCVLSLSDFLSLQKSFCKGCFRSKLRTGKNAMSKEKPNKEIPALHNSQPKLNHFHLYTLQPCVSVFDSFFLSLLNNYNYF